MALKQIPTEIATAPLADREEHHGHENENNVCRNDNFCRDLPDVVVAIAALCQPVQVHPAPSLFCDQFRYAAFFTPSPRFPHGSSGTKPYFFSSLCINFKVLRWQPLAILIISHITVNSYRKLFKDSGFFGLSRWSTVLPANASANRRTDQARPSRATG
jgi:hypothetical protein